MLQSLSIRNVVLIDTLDIDLESGLCVLTGETGAGKSILLDSMGLVLGARSERGLVGKSADKASVSAVFSLAPDHSIFEILNEQDISYEEGELVLRRVVQSDGRSKAFINDQAVSTTFLKDIGGRLVDIHSQFETHSLLDPKSHCGWLDMFGGHENIVKKMQHAWHDWQDARRALIDAKKFIEDSKNQEEFLKDCLDEFERVSPLDNEEADLMEQRHVAQAAESIVKTCSLGMDAVDGEQGALPQIYQAWKEFDRLGEDLVGSEIFDSFSRAEAELKELSSLIEQKLDRIGHGETSLETIDERLHALRSLARKHHCLTDQLLEKQTELQSQYDLINAQDTNLAKLEVKMNEAKDVFYSLAKDLSGKRKNAAIELQQIVMDSLPPLKLEKATFVVSVESDQDVDKADSHGLDDVKFLLSANPGMPPAPLNKAASGGELSRIMLALKVAFSKRSTVPVMVFDEIDSGIGGATADAVGEKLESMAIDHQVLVVTHSPQVAAKAKRHFIVSKATANDNMTRTSVVTLYSHEERREEIARMLSGSEITSEARAAAERLLA